MKLHGYLACSLALLGLAAPANADVRTAAFAVASDRPLSQTSAFVGGTFRLALNRRAGEPRYQSAIGISGMTRNPATSEFRVGQGLELAFDGSAKPKLRLAGMDSEQLQQTANMSGGAKTTLIVVGTLAALGVGVLVALDSLPCTDDDDPCD